jgi:hypothetical protein
MANSSHPKYRQSAPEVEKKPDLKIKVDAPINGESLWWLAESYPGKAPERPLQISASTVSFNQEIRLCRAAYGTNEPESSLS